MYDFLSLIYNNYMDDIDYEGWTKYLKRLITRENFNPKSILEYGCGTGNITEPLSKEFPLADITGVDLSEGMLLSKLNQNSRINYLHGDMRNFSPIHPVDCIICACDTLNHLKPEDLPSLFKKIYNELNTPGIFLFDTITESYLTMIDDSGPFTYISDEVCFIWDLNIEGNRVDYDFTFFIKEGNLYKRENERITEYVFSPDFIIESLKKAGFESIVGFDFKSERALDFNSERIQYIALKK